MLAAVQWQCVVYRVTLDINQTSTATRIQLIKKTALVVTEPVKQSADARTV
jgi:hypothetical protein